MESSALTTEAKPTNQPCLSPKKRSPKKSPKKQNNQTCDPVVNLPSTAAQPKNTSVNSPSKAAQPKDSFANLPPKAVQPKDSSANLLPKAVQPKDSSANLPPKAMQPNDPTAKQPIAPNTLRYPANYCPTVPSPSQPSTSSNHSPLTPIAVGNPFIFQNPQNGLPYTPNMAQRNGKPYIPQSQNALQEYLVQSLKINQDAHSSSSHGSHNPHVDSLRITVNNELTRRTVHSQAFQNVLGTRTPYQFNFPASVPFQYDQRLKQSHMGRQRPVVNAQPKRNDVVTNNVAASYQQQVSSRQKGRDRDRDYEEDDFYKKVIVIGFPAYTKAEELVRHLSTIGKPQVELMRNRVAVVVFNTQLEAIAAVNANDTIPVYGSILNILKYTNRRHVMELMKQNRKTIVKHVHKGPVIKPPKEIDLKGDFYDQMRNIEQAIRLTQEEVDAINPLFEDIEKFMRMIFHSCEAIPFGSITTGQGIKSSDADCFLALKPGRGGRPGLGAAEHSSTFVTRAAKLMRMYPQVFAHIVAIPKANTPIVKFLHLPTNMCCDLNSKTPLGVQNSRLLGHMLTAERAGRFGSVALLLKYWARAQDLSGTGKLTNYALTLMLIAYLQKSYLPSVVSLQGPAHSFIVENWEAGFDSSPLRLEGVPPMRDLLGGFFLYYAGFDFEELVVCPFMGRTLRKAEFDSDVLPEEFALYRHNVAQGLALRLRTGRCLCVQDPFELSHNVASPVTSRLAAEIKAHITLAAAAYNAGEKVPGDFLRTILLTRPPPSELFLDTRVATRISLPPRLLDDVDGDWRLAVRRIVTEHVYRDMMLIDLQRRDAVSREPEVEIEVYVGEVTKPVWMRGWNTNGRCPEAPEMVLRHKDITQRILQNKNLPELKVPFEVELGFRSEPRGVNITTTAMDGADPEPFRAFRHFSHTFINRWFKELLKPYLKKVTVCLTNKHGEVINQQIHPDQFQQLQQPKKRRARQRKQQIDTVAFVNTAQKELTDAIAAVSLGDSENKDST